MVGPRGWMSGRADARYNNEYCLRFGWLVVVVVAAGWAQDQE